MPAADAALPVMARGHAGEKVSDLPELLEMVLLHLDYEKIARDAYHVNSAFRNCILGSPEIRQRMFLSPQFSPSFGPPGSNRRIDRLICRDFDVWVDFRSVDPHLRITIQGLLDFPLRLQDPVHTFRDKMFLTNPARPTWLNVQYQVRLKEKILGNDDRWEEVQYRVKIFATVKVAAACFGDLLAVARELLNSQPKEIDTRVRNKMRTLEGPRAPTVDGPATKLQMTDTSYAYEVL